MKARRAPRLETQEGGREASPAPRPAKPFRKKPAEMKAQTVSTPGDRPWTGKPRSAAKGVKAGSPGKRRPNSPSPPPWGAGRGGPKRGS